MIKNSNRETALIATLPKSGTWFTHTFFWCYDHLLRNQDKFLYEKIEPDLLTALRDQKIGEISTHVDTFGLNKLFICHTVCPGFKDLNDFRYEQWTALHFPIVGYNREKSHVAGHKEWDLLRPQINPYSRIIYLYRNPLDHLVSYFDHSQTHSQDHHRFKILLNGSRVLIDNLYDFAFSFGCLSGFIKHYYSFKQMHLHFPENVMMLPYETLIKNPRNSFFNMLSFLGIPPDNDIKYQLFEHALLMSSKDFLISIENKLNRSMVGDRLGNSKHINGGEIGKWKSRFSNNDLESIETGLNAFNISLADFDLSDNESTLSQLPWLLELKNQRHKLVFFNYQLEDTGKRLLSLEQDYIKDNNLINLANEKIKNLENNLSSYKSASKKLEEDIADEKIDHLEQVLMLYKLYNQELDKVNSKIKHLEQHLMSYKLKINEMDDKIHALQGSKSWRITAPLRKLSKFSKKAFKIF